ncbi:hypothetical protein [Pseudaestuariivita rosea]|uniref:hypothetical protein n=1 Tax=Pseudaestuariivita rosea TaxID=2763263 RepID=UPI001ABA8B1D|nr:hypothetical protein [Pseudaestuariivita rosea]
MDDGPDTPLPPQIALQTALSTPPNRFRVINDEYRLWFERRSDVLYITFDNLATIDEDEPRKPWMWRRVEDLGYSVLGIQSFRKDWYRHQTTGPMIRDLAGSGLFAPFRSVVLMGASMGGFAALNFAPLIPDARVLAFSPQSTMNQKIAPYERRFRYSVRRSNWDGMPFLDAAAAIPYIPAVSILYDPLVPEDKAHVARMTAPHVQLLRLNHATHEAIRVVIYCDALHQVMRDMAETGRVGPMLWQKMRYRRMVRKWARQFTGNLDTDRHPKLSIAACNALLKAKPDQRFAKLARAKAEANLAKKENV